MLLLGLREPWLPRPSSPSHAAHPLSPEPSVLARINRSGRAGAETAGGRHWPICTRWPQTQIASGSAHSACAKSSANSQTRTDARVRPRHADVLICSQA